MSIIWPSLSITFTRQYHFRFDIHEGPDLKNVVSKYEVNSFKNNKGMASYIKKKISILI
jgi:hypothetical protein